MCLLLLLVMGLDSSELLLMVLLLELDLVFYDLFLAWFLAILVTTRMLALVPASAADAWTRHYTNYSKNIVSTEIEYHLLGISTYLRYSL